VRRAVGLLVTTGLLLGASSLAGTTSAAASTAVPDGAFSCTDAAPADLRLSALTVTPATVLTGAGPTDVVFSLDAALVDAPVVTLATADGVTSFSQPAVADPAGWRAQLLFPEDAPTAELGVTIAWTDGLATPCGLRARGLPSVVALHPVAPAPPQSLTAVAGDGQAVLTWGRAADGGAPLTGYRVVTRPGGQVRDISDPEATRTVLTGLTNGTAYAFDLTAVTAAGTSPVATSSPVVPRRRLFLGSVTVPPAKVTYGTVSTVTAVVRNAAGAGVGGVAFELWARRYGMTTWTTVARTTSTSTGAVVLRAALKTSSALAVVHRTDAYVVPTAAANGVTVMARVTAAASDSTPGAGYRQLVSGSVAPGGLVGSSVWLQRYYSGAWHQVATGSLVTTTSYRVRWTPRHAGDYWLRVVRPGAAGVATGWSRTLHVTAHETRISVARDILADSGTRLMTYHFSGVWDSADARHNILDPAAGRAARRSSYDGAPGGSVMLDMRTLRLLRQIGKAASVTVSEVAGGSHSPGSLHYQGTALDVYAVNGVVVSPGSGYMVVVRTCWAMGATEVYYPAHDPGGHQHHVHCAFE
jgi:hypothetical protein